MDKGGIGGIDKKAGGKRRENTPKRSGCGWKLSEGSGKQNAKSPQYMGAFASHRTLPDYKLAEEVGFEPTDACASTVFKTAAFGRSATPPFCNYLFIRTAGSYQLIFSIPPI